MQCNAGLIYSSKYQMCQKGVPRVDHASKKICQKINCDKTPNEYILFPANPAYYAQCSNVGGIQSMVMHKCDDVDNTVYDIARGVCVYKCKAAGYFADPLDCTAYYFCDGWIKYESNRMTCPGGFYFDGTAACISSMAHCPPGSTPTTTTTTITPPNNGGPQISTTPARSYQMIAQADAETTSKSPIFPSYSLWKHKGKYSIRMGKFV